MSKTWRTEAIVLQRRDWRENDSLFTLLTRELGRVDVVSIGTKKIKSKNIGHLSCWGVVDTMIARSKFMDRLATARLVNNFELDLDENYPFMMAINDMLLKCLMASEKDEQIWGWLIDIINWLKLAKNSYQKKIVVLIFGIRLIKYLGYESRLDNCAICGQHLEHQVYFGFKENGIVCQREDVEKKTISCDCLRLLRIAFADEWRAIDHLAVKKVVIDECLSFVMSWVKYNFGKELLAWDYLVRLVK